MSAAPPTSSSFLTTHRQTILIASAALATVAAGASIYYLSSPASAPAGGKDKRKKKKSKKATSPGPRGESGAVEQLEDDGESRCGPFFSEAVQGWWLARAGVVGIDGLGGSRGWSASLTGCWEDERGAGG